ncbi:MAG TPA: HAD family phosphatase [Polyangiaceae bacterium LLY-WYZ-15_(1-7)]|nr:HAD family phosphatase [Polyangiaceae bacterium LLY-WYZ-15_(1-7)]HJL00601.1 HAD family phosphatase [Polyangiaceae bacterium LLY-WYZ-15_(1-7)]HJL13199.1 HAD family phosphatase [Polyangiaceae bacterium LLY-WYZ-15_(1-7)]HJL30065.1 HAD family phosphatase [Polyangiaceae bacterium LLY-WYZ-15_(1-7)]HJL45201.1 HAD family phosphatase [Polyangiaceae bacterium LLY-WYZ-15_(1-7)]
MAKPSPVLLLDVMGTLVHDPFHEDMPRFFGMSLEELLEAKHPDAWLRFERGEMSSEDFLAIFFADGRPYDVEGFVRMVRDAYAFLPGVEPLLRELRAAGVPMHALSNYPTWYRWIDAKLDLGRYLEWSFVSCHTGVRKPDPRAYTGAAERLGVPPERCLFVDDRESNVRAAREVGMGALRFEGADALEQALVERGLLPR